MGENGESKRSSEDGDVGESGVRTGRWRSAGAIVRVVVGNGEGRR